MTVGERIKAARMKKGLTQKELGALLEISQAAVAQFEKQNGSLRIDTLERIANVLETTVFHLLGHDKVFDNLDNEKFDWKKIAFELDIPIKTIEEIMYSYSDTKALEKILKVAGNIRAQERNEKLEQYKSENEIKIESTDSYSKSEQPGVDLQFLIDAFDRGETLLLDGEPLSVIEAEAFINAFKAQAYDLDRARKLKNQDVNKEQN